MLTVQDERAPRAQRGAHLSALRQPVSAWRRLHGVPWWWRAGDPVSLLIRPVWRWWSAAVACFALASGIGPIMDERPYAAPIFGTVRDIAGWHTWAVAWCLVAATALVAAVTRRAWAWRTATIGAIAIAATWVTGIVLSRFVDGNPISPTGLALWGWFLATNLLAVLSPFQFEGAA